MTASLSGTGAQAEHISPGGGGVGWSRLVRTYYDFGAQSPQYMGLLETYAEEHGEIQDSFFCVNCEGAAVLTKSGRLEHGTAANTLTVVDPLMAHQLLFQCEELRDRIVEFLPVHNRMPVLYRLYAVITYVLGSLDDYVREAKADPSKSPDATRHRNELEFLAQELKNVEKRYLNVAARAAQVYYFKGMLLGASALGVVVALAGAILVIDDVFPGALLAAAAAGGIGAIVSVMWRMTVGKLTLEPEAGLDALQRLGALRPFIGAVFALALFVLAEGEIVPLEHPEGGPSATYFYAALGFLAGFSERFAQDMLAGGEKGLTAGSGAASS